MTTQEFFQQLDARIAKYDLLCHPFYKPGAQASLRAKICGNMRRIISITSKLFLLISGSWRIAWKTASCAMLLWPI